MKAFVFPGQGSQFPGMGKDLYDSQPNTRAIFDKANEILGFQITEVMFHGSAEDLKQTNVTQPAIFIHSVAVLQTLGPVKPDMVAGHSLGEFSALVAAEVLSFELGLQLVAKRAAAMQKACELHKGAMAAIIGMEDKQVEDICAVTDGVVVAANYNCPGQLVISGELQAVEQACENLKAAGAARALLLPVGGAFHSPLMDSAQSELETAINSTSFKDAVVPVYQNVTATPVKAADEIKLNLIRQLTGPVRWTQIMQHMIADGATEAIEIGPGKVLQGLFKKVDRKFETSSPEI